MKNQSYHTTTLGLARSLLALGFLLTLICNSLYDLFPPYHLFQTRSQASGIEMLNIFYWFSYKWILVPYIFSIIVLCAVISGYYPRITCILHAWVSYSIFASLLIVE